MAQINEWIDIYLHLSQYLSNKSYDQNIARTDCINVFSGHFPITNYSAIYKTTEMKRYRQTHTMVSDMSPLSIHISIIFYIASSHLIVSKSRIEMNGRTLVPGVFCFLKKYRTIIINRVIDYRIFRYRLKVSISQ